MDRARAPILEEVVAAALTLVSKYPKLCDQPVSATDPTAHPRPRRATRPAGPIYDRSRSCDLLEGACAVPNPLDMSDEDLQEILHGNLGQTTSYAAGAYLDEINRRAVDRQAREMIDLTASIRSLTAEIRGLSRLAMLIAAAALVVALVALVK